MRLYSRASSAAAWKPEGEPQHIVVGLNGMAWGSPFASAAKPGEPQKYESDKRTPAGFYRLGRPFGFARSELNGYLTIEPGQTFCVDDLNSPDYNHIVPKSTLAPDISGEKMWLIDVYRHGIVIDYPASEEQKTGSCIFFHLWKSFERGTEGCIGAEESVVMHLQNWAAQGETIIAMFPETTLDRFSACLPPGPPQSNKSTPLN